MQILVAENNTYIYMWAEMHACLMLYVDLKTYVCMQRVAMTV